jgi:hypothetical protein
MALSTDGRAIVDRAIAELGAAAREARRIAEEMSSVGPMGYLGAAFTFLPGGSIAAAALGFTGEDASAAKVRALENARQTEKGAALMREKAGTLTSDAQIPAFLDAVSQFAAIDALKAEAKQQSWGALKEQVVDKTARDVVDAAKKAVGLSAPYLAIAAGVVGLAALAFIVAKVTR